MNRAILTTLLISVLAACNSGGTSGPSLPQAPPGTGVNPIPMAGTWRSQDSTVIETSDPTATPVDGSMFVLSDSALVTIDNEDASRGALEADIGLGATWYVNQVDGRTMMYGFRFQQGAAFIELGATGGAVDANTIAVEALSRARMPGDDAVFFARTRYTLVRQPAPAVTPGVEERRGSPGTIAGLPREWFERFGLDTDADAQR